jgi:hypothetical protein
MAKRDGKQVAAPFGSAEPPHWNCSVTFASVEEAAAAPAGSEVFALSTGEYDDLASLGRPAPL